MCACDGPDVRGLAVRIIDRCNKIEEQQGVGLVVMQHVSNIKADAYALLAQGHAGYSTRETR